MSAQEIFIPWECPQCGWGVCVESNGFGRAPRRVHCGSSHDCLDYTCEWSEPLAVDLDAESWIITSRREAPQR